jgi:putative membrane protein
VEIAAKAMIGFVAVEHVGFLVIESFLWQTPLIRKNFGMTEQLAKDSAPLAKNQGLYNGFLAAGLAWALHTPDQTMAFSLALFFLACVIVAGIVGAATAKVSIFFIQAVPAMIALGLLWSGRTAG